VVSASRSSADYAPGPIPTDPGALRTFLAAELQKIQAAIRLLAAGHIDTSYAPPAKPRGGDIRLADGASWDPGSGVGVYVYYDAGSGLDWNKLG